MPLLLALATPALAADAEPHAPPAISLSLGGEISLNDPFVVQRGARLDAAVDPWAWLTVSGTAALHPDLGDDLLYQQRYLDQVGVTPDYSPIRARGQLAVAAWPLRGEHEQWAAAVGPLVGVGVVHTVDDADAIGTWEDDPRFAATARQWHPAPTYGLAGRLARSWWVLSVRLERISYVEQVDSLVQEHRHPLFASLSLGARL